MQRYVYCTIGLTIALSGIYEDILLHVEVTAVE